MKTIAAGGAFVADSDAADADLINIREGENNGNRQDNQLHPPGSLAIIN